MPEGIAPVIEPNKTPVGDALKANLEQQSPPPVVPAEGTPPPVVETPRSLLDRAKEFGFVDLADEAAATERVFAALQEQRALAEQATRRAQQLEELQLLREQYAQQGQQPPPAAAQATTDKWWNPPAVDQPAVDYYRNEDGTWKPEAPLEIRQQVQRYDAYHKAWAEKMVRKPEEAFTPLVDELVERAVAKRMAALEQKTAETAAEQKFLAENAAWLYSIDPVTNTPRRDRNTGAYLLSQDGLAFDSLMGEAAASGITDFSKQLEYAQRMKKLAQYEAHNGQQAATQQTQQTNEQKKAALLQSARGNPSAAGTFAAPGEQRSQNRNVKPGDRLRAQMQLDGVLAPNG